MANPWPCRSTVGFTLNFSRQQQTEESIPRHPQWFPAGVSPSREHTRDWCNQTGQRMTLAKTTAWILLQYLSIHEAGWAHGILPLRDLLWNGFIEAKNILSGKEPTTGTEIQLLVLHKTSPKSPHRPWVLHCFPFLNLMRISCCSGIFTVVSTSPSTTNNTSRTFKLKRQTKSMMFVQNYFCAHTNSPHSSLGPTQRTEIKWQRHRYGRLQGGIIPFHCIEMLLALPSHPALLDPVNPSTGKCHTAGKCDALK